MKVKVSAADLRHKPTVQHLMDLARKFRACPGDLYDGPYKALQDACYEALSTAQPAVREPLTMEQVFASEEIMAVNANIGLRMDQLMRVVAACEAHHGITGDSK